MKFHLTENASVHYHYHYYEKLAPTFEPGNLFSSYIGSVLFELSQNLLDRYKQQTMEEAEQHGGTFLFFMIPLEKMQFSYFGHVRRPNIAFSYISHYFSADRSRSTGG